MAGVWRSPVAAMVAATFVALGLTSCVPTVGQCVSWATFESPEQAFDMSEAVVIGELVNTGRTRQIYGESAALHEMHVQRVAKGEIDVGEQLTIASTPLTCMGDEVYPDGDPLEIDGAVALFLVHEDATGWRTIAPFDSVYPANYSLGDELWGSHAG